MSSRISKLQTTLKAGGVITRGDVQHLLGTIYDLWKRAGQGKRTRRIEKEMEAEKLTKLLEAARDVDAAVQRVLVRVPVPIAKALATLNKEIQDYD